MRRSGPLRRGKRMKAGKALKRKTALARTSRAALPARRRDTGPSALTRAAVYKRDGNMCVCCGTSLAGRPRSVGHRKRRSQGGSNETSNLVAFLGLGINPFDPDDHHARIDSRRDPEDEAKGYTVRSWGDPAATSVMIASQYRSGATAWLTDDGEYSFSPPGEAAA
jgi:hypothetical protein